MGGYGWRWPRWRRNVPTRDDLSPAGTGGRAGVGGDAGTADTTAIRPFYGPTAVFAAWQGRLNRRERPVMACSRQCIATSTSAYAVEGVPGPGGARCRYTRTDRAVSAW